MKVRWLLQSGPNNSHLWDNDFYDRKKDAIAAAENLPLAPDGRARPYVIRRLKYHPVNSVFDKIEETIVIQNLREFLQ